MALIFAIAAIVVGLLFIVGGLRGWKLLIDPPERSWLLWPLRLLRSATPAKYVPWVIAVNGLVYVAFGLMVLSRWLGE